MKNDTRKFSDQPASEMNFCGAWTAVGAAAVGAVGSAYASSENKKAAEAAANAASNAGTLSLAASKQAQDKIQSGLDNSISTMSLYTLAGQNANTALNAAMGFGTSNTASLSGSDQAANQAIQQQYNGALTGTFDSSKLDNESGYKFRLDQGNAALTAKTAAGGNRFGAQALKDAVNYNQAAASQEYQNAYDRYMNNKKTLFNQLSGMSSAGQNAASTVGNWQNSAASNQANLITDGQSAANNYNTGAAGINANAAISANNNTAGIINNLTGAVSSAYIKNGGWPSAGYSSGTSTGTGYQGTYVNSTAIPVSDLYTVDNLLSSGNGLTGYKLGG